MITLELEVKQETIDRAIEVVNDFELDRNGLLAKFHNTFQLLNMELSKHKLLDKFHKTFQSIETDGRFTLKLSDDMVMSLITSRETDGEHYYVIETLSGYNYIIVRLVDSTFKVRNHEGKEIEGNIDEIVPYISPLISIGIVAEHDNLKLTVDGNHVKYIKTEKE